MNYRPDIDGLRAIAIILVLIYHGELSIFPSGFIGVDVFFVISGFLITGIICQSLANGTFSFIDFYNRRLWRLQPVFVCLIFVSSIATLLLYLPDDLIQFSRSARKTSLFVSNIFFNKTTTGYFAPNTLQLPLLHTWSLSIEWQCYLLLPILIYSLNRFLSRKLVFIVLLGLTLFFLVVTLCSSKYFPAQSYYQFSSRIFEFLIGALIAIMPLKNLATNKYALNLAGSCALITIFYIASLDHILLGYPNGYAFLVCIATGVLLALGSFGQVQLVSQLLSIRPIVFIGLISYSLYIWHWPIFAILRYESFGESTVILYLAYVLTFLFAYLSWRYVEKPARKLNQIKYQYTIISLLILPIMMTHITSLLIKQNLGFPQRFSQELVTIYQQLDQYSSAQRPLCIDRNNTEQECTMGSKNSNSKKGLMIGDSFSNHYWGFLDTLGQSANVSILAQGTSSCITLPGIYLYDWSRFKNQVYQDCYEQTKKYYQMIQENHYDFVFLGQLWGNYYSDSVINNLGDERSVQLAKERIEYAMEKALKIITASGAKPVIINATASMKNNFHDCFFKHIKLHQSYNSNQCDFNLTLTENESWYNTLFLRMKKKYPKLILIDPKKIQCEKGICKVDFNGIPVYRDAGHITDYASYYMGKLYLQKFHNPLT